MPGRSQIPIESSHEGDVTVRTVILTVLLGCVVRLFVCLSTFIINQDGVLYVHQARALFYGQWDSVTSCGLSYLSPYPLCIAGAYFLVQDWTVAARGVSLVFGSAVLIPVFLLFRRFFDRGVSVAGLLIYATIPVLVSSSSDALREPVCWFFLAVGLYLFVSWMQDGGGCLPGREWSGVHLRELGAHRGLCLHSGVVPLRPDLREGGAGFAVSCCSSLRFCP